MILLVKMQNSNDLLRWNNFFSFFIRYLYESHVNIHIMKWGCYWIKYVSSTSLFHPGDGNCKCQGSRDHVAWQVGRFHFTSWGHDSSHYSTFLKPYPSQSTIETSLQWHKQDKIIRKVHCLSCLEKNRRVRTVNPRFLSTLWQKGRKFEVTQTPSA